MKERPILFSGPMVRAILEGRKSQTRRVIKNATGAFWDHAGWRPVVDGGRVDRWEDVDGRLAPIGAGAPRPTCPYGEPGDRLWVRESLWHDDGMSAMQPTSIKYAADVIDPRPDQFFPVENWRKVPSIHMPRWASRITLEIKDVRVERLQAISEADAIAEGVECEVYELGVPISGCWWNYQSRCWSGAFPDEPRGSFRTLWDSINGKTHPWSANPLVWVVEFAKVWLCRSAAGVWRMTTENTSDAALASGGQAGKAGGA